MSISALEQYIITVRTLSEQGNFSQLCDFISKSAETLSKNEGPLNNVLATLDIQQDSLGVLGILCVKYSMQNIPDFETLFVQTQEFILSCNGEHPHRGIPILVTAINKIQLFPAQLTSIHADLCQLCLLSKNFKPALQFMDVDITDISKEGGHFDSKDFLCFYYYGGIIYTALKKYDRALYFFEIVITCPSTAVSHIMLEAYKKYILVALILHGKLPTLPKYTSPVVARYIKDTTMGLVKQCLTAMYKKNIQRLTKLQKCIHLDAKLKEMDNEIAVNPQYVQKSSGMHDDDIPGSSKMQSY
ncbi:CSN3-like protein [Mya arenaria]|uniref:CSN3-like protein n=1 Tax=Mya arenaria TaxID=6604 RepID=A0ABY7DHG0_MYAAR|nr:CSN3-like protein [Mya arenaria]